MVLKISDSRFKDKPAVSSFDMAMIRNRYKKSGSADFSGGRVGGINYSPPTHTATTAHPSTETRVERVGR